MECPRCGLLSPPEALRCDCGWDFAAQSMKPSYLHPADRNEPALARLEHRMGGRVVDMAIPFAIVAVASAALRAPVASNSAVETAVGCLMLGYLLFADGVKGGEASGNGFSTRRWSTPRRSLPARWASPRYATSPCCSFTSSTGVSSFARGGSASAIGWPGLSSSRPRSRPPGLRCQRLKGRRCRRTKSPGPGRSTPVSRRADWRISASHPRA